LNGILSEIILGYIELKSQLFLLAMVMFPLWFLCVGFKLL
jgi:hypothetical protein